MEDPGTKSLAAINDHNEPDTNWGTHDKEKKKLQPNGLPTAVSRTNCQREKAPALPLGSSPSHYISPFSLSSLCMPELSSEASVCHVLVSAPSLPPLVRSLPACPQPDFTTNALRTCSPVPPDDTSFGHRALDVHQNGYWLF